MRDEPEHKADQNGLLKQGEENRLDAPEDQILKGKPSER